MDKKLQGGPKDMTGEEVTFGFVAVEPVFDDNGDEIPGAQTIILTAKQREDLTVNIPSIPRRDEGAVEVVLGLYEDGYFHSVLG